MYIDGVFSGGGMKGIALVGAYEALEKRGFRFKRLAGTSAGSIIASFIAAGYTSAEIRQMMEELNESELLDPRFSLLPLKMLQWASIYWRLGLYKGDKLENWISEKLKAKGISVFGDLEQGKLKLIASDLSNGKMLVLPDDLNRYGLNPRRFSVARAVRMSCSIPYFFEPVKLKSSSGISVVVDGPPWQRKNVLDLSRTCLNRQAAQASCHSTSRRRSTSVFPVQDPRTLKCPSLSTF
ncbi:patatin-like phospholipase family protein, partial [Bacillus paralicheniformis]|uniref:patatin-like phospholipase family protein n=1 Tax=Bacillus paralicheniformis TaxID=1648923 RepID=UPI002DBC407C